ncbi:hypothetical protein BH24DEI2_BH24DEI2_01670 [soil metagenome]
MIASIANLRKQIPPTPLVKGGYFRGIRNFWKERV